ncbi:tripartite tricarboxylate transporter TctB family protein [Albimonas sp. CAU 1670]|uniref:tripartite tricarboxylate transporter TctB family protein n=1 Tax=Albimonas sp. CAU 1670 TaxID=3032599 RepID=UPI0023DCB77C|nr:tripartite tricarboxylate transporter TctB family protein [Albimonas sp. CAU 1670]MDF2235142.1 tripartite tricarboxylate transporter TctB family protein [Albimonas sp. CAU 1670]
MAQETRSPRRLRAHWGAAGALFLIGLAICFMVGGLELGLGVLFRPGTGAFPFFTGLILAGLCVAILVQDLADPGLAERPDWISFAAIAAALAVFAATADRLGLVPAAFLTTVVASVPDRSLPFPGKAALGAAVALGSWLLFIQALGLPFKAIAGI